MKKNLLLSMAAAASILTIAGCTKEPTEHLSAEESRIYITNRDSSVNFSSFNTFSIADSITVIENNQLVARENDASDAGFISAIKNEMQQRGYTLVEKSQTPDIGINVSKIFNTYTGVVSYPDYWGDYYDYYDPFYWGYGGSAYYFPPYYDVYQVSQGALSVDLLNLKDAGSTKQIKGLWQGLIRGSGIFNDPPAGQIKALFDQSDYLRKNQ